MSESDNDVKQAIQAARVDALEFGYQKWLSDHLLQFSPPERHRRILALMVELEVWLTDSEHLEAVDVLVRKRGSTDPVGPTPGCPI